MSGSSDALSRPERDSTAETLHDRTIPIGSVDQSSAWDQPAKVLRAARCCPHPDTGGAARPSTVDFRIACPSPRADGRGLTPEPGAPEVHATQR